MPHYGLFLSDMRVAHYEDSDKLVAYSPRREDLEELLRREKVPLYNDPKGDGTVWIKTFRKHGPLEWCNDARARPPGIQIGFFVMVLNPDVDSRIEQIYTYEEYMEEHGRRYRNLLESAYDAGMMEAQMVVEHPALPAGDGEEHEQEDEEEANDHATHRQGEGHHQVDDGQGRNDV